MHHTLNFKRYFLMFNAIAFLINQSQLLSLRKNDQFIKTQQSTITTLPLDFPPLHNVMVLHLQNLIFHANVGEFVVGRGEGDPTA